MPPHASAPGVASPAFAAYRARVKKSLVLAFLLSGNGALLSQEPVPESATSLAERIRGGGWFETSKWRRGDDGALELHYFADTGMPDLAQFVPLLGVDLERGLVNGGAIGFLSMVLHGNGDLLGMTDADFHFRALGIEPTDVGLRQFLAVQPPSFEGQRGRAELLDRLLAIDVLCRRGVKSSIAELSGVATAPDSPTVLRNRAARAIAMLRGNPDPLARARLTAEALRLPAAFDACVMIDHARLPDLNWLSAFGRRLGALVTAQAVAMAGGTVSPAMCNGAQSMCDVTSELPFGLAHRYGNLRMDHSCVVVSAKADPMMPVAIAWQAAGAFEPLGWRDAALPAKVADNNPLFRGSLSIEADHIHASTDGSQGKPRPTLVDKLQLLRSDDSAVRVIVPANSKLWPAIAFLEMPSATGAELRITCGDPAVIVLAVETRDEETAEAWVAKGGELLAQLKSSVESELPEQLAECAELQELLRTLFAVQLSTKDATAYATIEIKGLSPKKLHTIAEAALR